LLRTPIIAGAAVFVAVWLVWSYAGMRAVLDKARSGSHVGPALHGYARVLKATGWVPVLVVLAAIALAGSPGISPPPTALPSLAPTGGPSAAPAEADAAMCAGVIAPAMVRDSSGQATKMKYPGDLVRLISYRDAVDGSQVGVAVPISRSSGYWISARYLGPVSTCQQAPTPSRTS